MAGVGGLAFATPMIATYPNRWAGDVSETYSMPGFAIIVRVSDSSERKALAKRLVYSHRAIRLHEIGNFSLFPGLGIDKHDFH